MSDSCTNEKAKEESLRKALSQQTITNIFAAANQGSSAAQTLIWKLYKRGLLKVSYEIALKWLVAAAFNENEWAVEELAKIQRDEAKPADKPYIESVSRWLYAAFKPTREKSTRKLENNSLRGYSVV